MRTRWSPLIVGVITPLLSTLLFLPKEDKYCMFEVNLSINLWLLPSTVLKTLKALASSCIFYFFVLLCNPTNLRSTERKMEVFFSVMVVFVHCTISSYNSKLKCHWLCWKYISWVSSRTQQRLQTHKMFPYISHQWTQQQNLGPNH